MANPVVRNRVLELLEEGDATVKELADQLEVLPNTVSKALAHARENGGAHIVAYVRRAPVHRHGPGVERPADPVAPDEERHDASNAKVHNVQMPVYFELDGGLLPGVRHFACDRLRASMSVSSCGTRWEKANSTDVDADRFHTCRRCAIGAAHAGRIDHNPSQFKGMTICGRCHTGATRLIGKHVCVSCFNRARELRIGKNGKGTAPRKLARLDRRSITYRAGGVVKTRVFEESVDMTELVVAVLRDEQHAPQLGWRAPASMDWLRDDGAYDRSISDSVQEQGAVASPVGDARVSVSAELGVVQTDPAADVDVDPVQTLRDAVDQRIGSRWCAYMGPT
ncbi:ArsR/SmtB family transcription factor [Paraburkholderia sacchari]|uniref:ArsR/SmtB family transcription factor n=1 Tax=Paraburkholderia sacchari TaxID=159450 RepID=UPI003D99BBB6